MSGWYRGRHEETRAARSTPESMTFFVRNFPEFCSADTLRRRFEAIGKLHEVVIPAKKDKNGRKFGFVRFYGVGKEGEILDKLNKMWIGSHIIRANLPRFERVEVETGGGSGISWVSMGGLGLNKSPYRSMGRGWKTNLMRIY